MQSAQNNNNPKANSKPIMLPNYILVLFFITPLVIALIMYLNWNNIYLNKKPHGKIINPSFTVELTTKFNMDDHLIKSRTANNWHIIYLAPQDCMLSCHKFKAKLAKLEYKLQKQLPNVNLIATPSSLLKMHDHNKYQALLMQTEAILITKPNNEVIMYYPKPTNTNKIFKDITRLIKQEANLIS